MTPNAHALADQFVLLDHFFASGGNSADGHQWLTQANETEYPMWPLYQGRSYPSEGDDALTYSLGGFLWETAQAKGKWVSVFGEYAPAPSDSIASVRRDLLAAVSRLGGPFAVVFPEPRAHQVRHAFRHPVARPGAGARVSRGGRRRCPTW